MYLLSCSVVREGHQNASDDSFCRYPQGLQPEHGKGIADARSRGTRCQSSIRRGTRFAWFWWTKSFHSGDAGPSSVKCQR